VTAPKLGLTRAYQPSQLPGDERGGPYVQRTIAGVRHLAQGGRAWRWAGDWIEVPGPMAPELATAVQEAQKAAKD
jgi:hypothetical protein